MIRKVTIGVLALAASACAGLVIAPPAPRPGAATVAVDVIVACQGAPAADVVVSVSGMDQRANRDGWTRYQIDARRPATEPLMVKATGTGGCDGAEYADLGWSGVERIVGGKPGPVLITLPVTAPVIPPAPVLPEKATGEALLDVRANFCNLRDSQGRVMFAPFRSSLSDEDRADWYSRERAAGSTHLVISPQYGYPGSPIPGRDFYGDPRELRRFVMEALETPSADGKGFRPIIILDSGDWGIRERVDKFWPGIAAALADVNDNIIVVPGWELIKASHATSADLSYALQKLKVLGFKHIWMHLSPGRAAGSSNPVETDDPWQGGESDFFKRHGGEFIEGLLYQSEPIEDGDPVECDATQESCWLNRWEDVVPRLGNGMNGWRPMRLVMFENIAYTYYRGRASEKLVRDMATAAQKMCQKYNVKCGFGNGLPWVP